MKTTNLNWGARQILSIIRSILKYCKQAFPSQEWLATKLGCCVRTIKRYVRELRESGLLIVHRRQHLTAIYELVSVPSDVPSEGENVPSGAVPPMYELTDNQNQHTPKNACGVPNPTPLYPHTEQLQRFVDQYPGQQSDLAVQLFISVVNTPEDASRFARNFAAYLECDQWRRGIVPNAENFLSKGMWKYPPPRGPQQTKSRWDRWIEKIEREEATGA